MKCKYLSQMDVIILTNIDDDPTRISSFLQKNSLDWKVFAFSQELNYLRKNFFAIQYAENNNIPYLFKHDNDLLVSQHIYDYLFENIDILEDSKNLLLTPTLSSGIPTVEQFLHDFCTPDEIRGMFKTFAEYEFGTTWGVDYRALNKHTIQSNGWNPKEYYNGIKEFNHYYKGIHPVRVYKKAIEQLNTLVLKYKDDIMAKRDFKLIFDDVSPYFCDSLFIMKTGIWKTILNTQEFYVDDFDEVPLNRYRNKNNQNIVYTRNGAAIHVIYNSIPNYLDYEVEFMKKFNGVSSVTTFTDCLKKYESYETVIGTDKNTTHAYGETYNRIFEGFRDKPINLLEIGVQTGSALLAYADYFPNAKIYGIDVVYQLHDTVKKHPRIEVAICNALTSKNIFNERYDIIIEDASHTIDTQFQHLQHFAEFINKNGYYIIEDIHESNFQALYNLVAPFAKQNGFDLEVCDLRPIKKRFDDILFVLKKL